MPTETPTTPPAPALLRIQEVAAETGLTTRAIRYYEEVGLLEPAARSDGAYRLYDASDLDRLRFIRSLRDDAGFSLAQIGQLLEDEVARERNRERLQTTTDPDERRDPVARRPASAPSARSRSLRGEVGTPRHDDRRGPQAAHPPRYAPRRARGEERPDVSTDRAPMIDPTAGRPRVRRIRQSRALSAFGHRNYRLFFVGQMVSLVGTWMQQVAQGWLVLQISGGNPLWLGIVAAAQFMPVMVFGLFGGVLADVLPKRQTLVATQVVQMVLAVVLAILTATGLVEIWMVVTLALLLGCASAVDMPVRQSFAIEMVGPREVGNAVSLNSAQFNGARVVGPAIAGVAIGAFGIATAFAINAVSFLAVILGLWLMRDEELHRPRLLAPTAVGRGGRRQPRRGAAVRAPHAGRAHGGRDRRAVGDVRDELHGHHPATRPGRAVERRGRLRVPHDGVRGRGARGGPGARHRRHAARRSGSRSGRSSWASPRSCWPSPRRIRSRCC